MQNSKKLKYWVILLILCVLFIGASLAGCQTPANTITPTSFTNSAPTVTPPVEVGEATIESATMEPTISLLPTPAFITPTPTDDASQLTSMHVDVAWWSEDGRTLYFSTRNPDLQIWSIDLATSAVRPTTDTLDPYQQAISLTAALIPNEVSEYDISVSPTGKQIIFPRPITPPEPAEEFCDGESCIPIPANEIWVIDVESRESTQLQMEDELITMDVSFRWSDDESRVVFGADPFWVTGSDTPTVWVADILSEIAYPVRTRDDHVFPGAISPTGDFITYGERSSEDSCTMYLWTVASQDERLLPDMPCSLHFWLSDNQTIVFARQIGLTSLFFAYDTATFERRVIASSTILPTLTFRYFLAPDDCSVAVIPVAAWDPSGIWLIRFDLSTDRQ